MAVSDMAVSDMAVSAVSVGAAVGAAAVGEAAVGAGAVPESGLASGLPQVHSWAPHSLALITAMGTVTLTGMVTIMLTTMRRRTIPLVIGTDTPIGHLTGVTGDTTPTDPIIRVTDTDTTDMVFATRPTASLVSGMAGIGLAMLDTGAV
jgi:hypothetical protein